MERKPYPTRNGIALCPAEIGLPSSNLNILYSENLENHHNAWPRKDLNSNSLFRIYRALARNQFILPADTHDFLHKKYEPPILPTPQIAIEIIGEAMQNKETMSYGHSRKQTFHKIVDRYLYEVAVNSYNEILKR